MRRYRKVSVQAYRQLYFRRKVERRRLCDTRSLRTGTQAFKAVRAYADSAVQYAYRSAYDAQAEGSVQNMQVVRQRDGEKVFRGGGKGQEAARHSRFLYRSALQDGQYDSGIHFALRNLSVRSRYGRDRRCGKDGRVLAFRQKGHACRTRQERQDSFCGISAQMRTDPRRVRTPRRRAFGNIRHKERRQSSSR